MSGTLLGPDLGGAGDGHVEDDGGDSLGYRHHQPLPARPRQLGHANTKLVWIFAMYGATNNQICRVCPSAWECSAVLVYLNTGSNIETKGQMSGPKPEPASGGKRGKGLGARVTRYPAPAARGLHTEQGPGGGKLTLMLGIITVS